MKKLISLILSLSMLLALFNVVYAENMGTMVISQAPQDNFVDLEITEVYARSGDGGTYVKDWYKFNKAGFAEGSNVYMDRGYTFTEFPDKFLNAAFFQSRKNDGSNSYFLDESVKDWFKFDVNKSVTVYAIDYMPTDAPPMWVEEEGWEVSKTTEVGWKDETAVPPVSYTSTWIYKKHFDVEAGKSLTINLGGFAGKCYHPYTIIVIPDEKKEGRVIRFSEEELCKENWENEIVVPAKNSVIMFKNSNKAFKNGVKEFIDIRPVKNENGVFLPLLYYANAYGGTFLNNTLTYNGATYTVSGTNISGNGKSYDNSVIYKDENVLLKAEVLAEIFGKTFTEEDDGLTFIGDEKPSYTKEELKRILSLYLVDIYNLQLRGKYAVPGDEFIVPKGTYDSPRFKFYAYGTEEKNIVLTSEDPKETIITGYPVIRYGGEYVVFKGFRFESAYNTVGVIKIEDGKYCRFTENYCYDSGSDSNPGYHFFDFGIRSKYCRADHNTFERSSAISIGFYLTNICTTEEMAQYHTVDHNYFKDIRLCTDEFPSISNGRECLQVGTADLPGRSAFLTCEYNLFEDCYGDGNEIISNKSSDNIYRYNTFFQTRNLSSAVCIRTGDRVIWNRNYFINGSHGITSYGDGVVIINNYFYNIRTDAINLSTGNYNLKRIHYKQNRNTVVANNTIVNPWISGVSMSRRHMYDETYTYAPYNAMVYNNAIYRQNKNNRVIQDVASEDINYKTNITNVPEYDFSNEGFEFNNVELAKKGPLYFPENIDSYKEKGTYMEQLTTYDEILKNEGRTTADVGINSFTDEVIEKTFVTVDMVGPTDRWWVDVLRVKPHNVYEHIMSEGTPLSLKADRDVLNVTVGTEYHLDDICYSATYHDGKTDTAKISDISYQILENPSGIFVVNGNRLSSKGEGKGKIRATYKGITCDLLIDSKEPVTYYEDDFSTDKFLKNISKKGEWVIEKGILKNVNSNDNETNIINKDIYLKGDYKITFDVMFKGNSKKTDLNGGMVIGANDDFVNDYYKVFFGGDGSFYKKIRFEDTYPNSDNHGEVLEYGTIDTWHKAEIIRNKDWLVTIFNGKIASAIKIGDKAEGYIGFCSQNNNIEIDNLKVESYDAPASTTPAELKISDKRTDVYETELTVQNPPESDLFYKYYRNGVWITDTKNKSFKDLTMQDPRNVYNYEIYAVNKEGQVVGIGKTNVSLGEIPNDMFYMDNLRYKVETGGAYGLVDYHPNNRGYGTNGLTRNWDDDYGNYNEIPEEFYDAGYIQTLRSYSRYLPAAVYSDDDEWMKFDIHNKSATVYVLFSESVIPSWIYNGNWKKTYHYFDLMVSTNKVGHTYGVYKKHFTVKEGESRTIYLGPNGTNAFYHYCVIVVPDKD